MSNIWAIAVRSVGIAALAVAILLVPYSDLNADGSSNVCNNNCTRSGTPPNCSCGGTCDPAQTGATCTTCQPGTITIGDVTQCTCFCKSV